MPSILEIARNETMARRDLERRIQENERRIQETERRMQQICAILQAADKSNPDPAIAKALKIAEGAD